MSKTVVAHQVVVRLVAIVALGLVSGGMIPFGHPAASASKPATNGVRWSERYFALGSDRLDAISCPTVIDCVAVGSETSSTIDAGATWRRMSNPRATGSLSAVSCPSVSFCMESGGYIGVFEGTDAVLVSNNLGRSWSPRGTPPGNELETLSCARRGLCFALSVPSLEESTDGGSQWSDVALRGPPGDHSVTAAWVSCPSASNCFVSGTASPSGASSTSDLVVWKLVGSRFVRVLTRPRIGVFSYISCTTTGSCGVVLSSDTVNAYFATADSGARWSRASLPRSAQDVQALSCSGTMCIVLSTRGPNTPLLASTTSTVGRSWTTSMVVSSYPGGSYNFYNPPGIGLSCPSSSTCYLAGVGTGIVLEHTRDSRHWRPLMAAEGAPALQSVSCSPAGTCVAVGRNESLRRDDGGTSWITSTKGIAPNEVLDAVACPSATECVSAGRVGLDGVILRSTDGGDAWNSVHLPAGTAPLAGVACSRRGLCVATGPRDRGVLISTDLGAGWSLKAFPPSWRAPELTAVSCGSTSCLAVSSNQNESIDIYLSGTRTEWSLNAITGFENPVSVNCLGGTCWAEGTAGNGSPGTIIPGVYETTNAGATWELLGEPSVAGNPGLAFCDDQVCQAVSSDYFLDPSFDELATSTNGGASWSLDSTPSRMVFILAVTSSAGHWIAVGENTFGGPEVLTAN